MDKRTLINKIERLKDKITHLKYKILRPKNDYYLYMYLESDLVTLHAVVYNRDSYVTSAVGYSLADVMSILTNKFISDLETMRLLAGTGESYGRFHTNVLNSIANTEEVIQRCNTWKSNLKII
jgi:hypothetical protein